MARANGIGAATEKLAYPSLRLAKARATNPTPRRAAVEPVSRLF